jgi:hypothetical protein
MLSILQESLDVDPIGVAGETLRVRRKILEVREDLPRSDLDDSTCN